MMQLIGISGSLRKDSYNTALLRVLSSWVEAPDVLECVSFADVPVYDADLAEPASVERLKARISSADGVIIATPEYNYGVPGGLKNVLDWLSRPAYRSVFAKKKVGVLGASQGPVGTARAQGQLKQVLLGMVCDLFPAPEVTVGGVAAKISSEGALSDEATEKALRRFLADYLTWVRTA